MKETGRPLTAAAIAEYHPLLTPDDSVGRAIVLLGRAGVESLPVAEGGRLVGTLVAADVAARLAAQEAGLAEADGAGEGGVEGGRVREIRRPGSPVVPGWADLGVATEMLEVSGLSALPVVESDGRYLGLVTRARVVGALTGPKLVGGMATPLGVYLRAGKVRAGPGDLGLFLTGVVFMLLFSAAGAALKAAAWAIQQFWGLPLLSLYLNPGLVPNLAYFERGGLLTGLQAAGILALVLLFLRLSPLSATHGAEHQVAHAIEEGEELSLERVKGLSRVHARCGTNLVAILLILLGLGQYLTGLRDEEGIGWMVVGMVVVVVMLASWRRLGAAMQRYVTTRAPSARRLKAALGVGRELVAKYRAAGPERSSRWRRVWNLGMVQVVMGLAATYGVIHYLGQAAARWLGLT